MIAADAVLILPDDRSATRYPFAIARDKFNFLLSITRAWHVAQAGIVARPPLGDAGEGAERPKAVGDLDSAGVGRRENHRRTQQRECQSDAFCTGAIPTTLPRTFWLTGFSPSEDDQAVYRRIWRRRMRFRRSNGSIEAATAMGRDCCERKHAAVDLSCKPDDVLGAFPPRPAPSTIRLNRYGIVTGRPSILRANFFAAMGFANRKPCTRSNPISLTAIKSARVSTPSATVRAP